MAALSPTGPPPQIRIGTSIAFRARRPALEHERATLEEYYNLLALVEDKSVWLEELRAASAIDSGASR